MTITGMLKEFSIKSPFLEMSMSILKDKIETIQTDVKESKRQIEAQLTAISNNVQNIHSRIDSVMTNINIIANTVQSTAIANPILYVSILCDRLYPQTKVRGLYYANGKKYCRRCEYYLHHEGKFCPCCGMAKSHSY